MARFNGGQMGEFENGTVCVEGEAGEGGADCAG